ncbi:Serine/threonine-protein kinase cek1 [Hypsizygus marmoreus]|uniref:non-specific serine/threonine protein kinase n=1 Tax=Hypsizygus marmoreus TaxID=39966 RepID=A0A369JUV9_HYPMA|nr:Serine/threonine-protein kinase cek1 [Hypsizygus marmoreus]
MSDTGYQRRQPPSPLVFSPETVLSPPQSQQSNASSYGSGSNTVSMPFVRRHVTRRLKAAKAECDKELQRVTNNITAFFEERLREGDHETERELRDRERGRERHRDSLAADAEPLRDAFVFHPAEFGSSLQGDESSSDGGYEAEVEYGRHSRQRAYPVDNQPSPPQALTHWASSPGLNSASSGSQMSPGSLRRQSTAPWDRPLSSSMSSSAIAASPASSTVLLPETSLSRKPTNPNSAPTAWGTGGASSRRLSRTIHIPSRPTRSGQSSRSTSRSRSPLPPISTHTSFSDFVSSGPASANRRSSRILVDDPVDPIMTALYDLIGVATDVMDMSITQLTAQPKVCESLVQRIQNIGKAWDDHPDWHGRNWYVQVLLAVASLSRVVEWWEAEKQFWNFDDNDDEQDEPLMFVTKPADDDMTPSSLPRGEAELEGFRLNEEDESKGRTSKPTPQARKSRAEQHNDLSAPSSSHGTPELLPQGSSHKDHSESARILATERLRLQAETAHNQNIVMELSLDGDHFIWINHAWRVVVGTDPEALAGTRISNLLAPSDWGVFKEATKRLQEDDSHTVEVRFRLQIEPNFEPDPSAGILYQTMEGKGMLMIDREDGQPSHTMWVVKPIAPARYEHDTLSITLEAGDLAPEPASSVAPNFGDRTQIEPMTPFNFAHPIIVEPILCRICECQIPQWYFEKHSETCAETHRLEAEITECNESISELRNTIRDLSSAVDHSSSTSVPEYRGMPIFTPAASPIVSSPLQLFRANKMQRFGIKKMQKRLLDQLEDILQVASEISVPALKDEEAKEPIERQRLLSPGSERKISQIRNWSKPTTEDPALGQLVQDAERVMRQKIDNVVRMQNTIRYAEKIWHEWEERVGEALATVHEGDGDSDSDSDSDSDEDEQCRLRDDDEGDDYSSTRSVFAFGRDTSSGPTPLASSSPAPTPTPSDIRPTPMPLPSAPIPIYGARQVLHTRSSTPSSVSSPLALAAPIVAPSPDDVPPTMTLDDSPPMQIKTRKSAQSLLEPKFIITPPTSPLFAARDGPTLTREPSTKRGHRRQSTINPVMSPSGPLSPRQTPAVPITRTTPTSIKDFEIIKPISKGAFGSVFLAKKKVTGDYYAIKVLKKADMIAKNQITNVKAERMILMKQAESPFVAKLYFTFQSKDNLYLVMEYLNGGDCAALIKSLGSLPEEWTKNYIAEVVLGLEYLHQRGVVHRDLKPDNLLIDQHGHLKLTDFGLSRIGLLGRQTREGQTGLPLTRYNSRSRPPSIDSAYLSSPMIHADVPAGASYFSQRTQSVPRMGNSPYASADDIESSGSESLSGLHTRRNTGKTNDSPLQSFATELTNDLRSHSNSGGGTPPGEQKFVGTPDYLAPETILGLRGDDAAVDWWALGVITYEFLYGIPPFHADTPEKVFENILSGHIEWHEDWIEFSDEARDFMRSLMTLDPSERLGANGAEEVKAHPFFRGIDWDKVTTTEAAFIPQVTDPESTDYFDPRGAIPQLFHDDDQIAITGQAHLDSPLGGPSSLPASIPVPFSSKETVSTPGSDDFGSFSFKNLPILKQANDDVIRKLKTDQMTPLTHALTEPASHFHQRKRSVSTRIKKPPSVVTTLDSKMVPTNPPSPATSTSSVASSPSRTSLPPPTPGSGNHSRKPSEYGAVERFKLNHLEGLDRRNSMPSRLRTASVSSAGDGSGSETWNSSAGHGSHGSQTEYSTPPSSVHSIDLKKGPDPTDRAVTCLLAEDNPITAKIIETLLIRLGCRCVVVADGSEAISVAMGDIKFDCILMDLQMPVLDGESAARYIRSTNSKNTNTPIIAVSAYSGTDPSETSNVFTASLSKPLQKPDLLAVMRQLGFKTTTMQGGPGATKVTASQITS